MTDPNYTSIDENSLPNQSIDVSSAANNLKYLQRHIYAKFQNPTLAHSTQFMATSAHVRQDSLSDDDLFGPGANPTKSTHESCSGNGEYDSPFETAAVDNAALPNFCLMGLGSDDSQSESSLHGVCENISTVIAEHSEGGNENKSEQDPCAEDDNINGKKTKYLYKRSISELGKKKIEEFKKGSEGEVFFDPLRDIPVADTLDLPVRKVKSLPDLVLSSTLSNPDMKAFSSINIPLTGKRDVTLPVLDEDPKAVREELKMQKQKKDEIEGKIFNGKKYLRSVSFDQSDPHIIGVEKNEKEYMEEIGKDETTADSQKKRPADKRRQRYSSGYVTGASNGSQGTNPGSVQSQTSQISDFSSSQDSMNADQSFEIGNKMFDDLKQGPHAELKMEHEHFSKKSGNKDGFNSGSSNSSNSVLTIISVDTGENSPESYSTEPIQPPDKQVTNQHSLEQNNHDTTAFQSGKSDNIPYLSIMNEDLEMQGSFERLRIDPGVGVQRLPATNAPNPTPENSFSLRKSMLDKVDKEDDRIVNDFKKKYITEDPSLPGQQSLAGSLSNRDRSFSQYGPFSRNTMNVRHFDQLLKTDASPAAILQIIQSQFNYSDSSSPSPSPYTVEGGINRLPPSPPQTVFTLTDLERASRCNINGCPEKCCIRLADINQMLQSDMPVMDGDELLRHYCRALMEHNDLCEELSCAVVYCQEVSSWVLDRQSIETVVRGIVNEIRRIMREPVMGSLPYTDGTFHKLQDNIGNTPPRDLYTHMPLSRLGQFGAAILCLDQTSGILSVQQKYPQLDYKHQLSVYISRLRNVHHQHIVPQLWLMEYDDEKIQVCSTFMQGGSLQDCILSGVSLQWQQIISYMQQILSAICHLHGLGIIYLYWHSDNMLFTDSSRKMIKVGNFSLSYPLKTQSDLGATKACLPYNLCPPELLTNKNKIVCNSDSWGAGCLLAELLSGKPVWHDLRHENRDTVHSKIRTNFPSVDNVTKEQQTLIGFCWQQQPERRKSVKELYDLFSSKTTPANCDKTRPVNR